MTRREWASAVWGSRHVLVRCDRRRGYRRHIYPGLALAEAIRAAVPGARVTFVGTRLGLEGRIVPREGYPPRVVDMVPFTGRYRWRLPAALAVASLQCVRLLREIRADVVVGMGAYCSAPLVVAASWWRHRTDVHLVIKAGAEGAAELNRRLAADGATHVATAVEYFERMDTVYAAADLTVCRAGAGTIAELGQVGLPAVLAPYPHAAHDHQTHNAMAL